MLELHAEIRPDIFIPGTTKYTKDEVVAIIKDKHRRTYVADKDIVTAVAAQRIHKTL